MFEALSERFERLGTSLRSRGVSVTRPRRGPRRGRARCSKPTSNSGSFARSSTPFANAEREALSQSLSPGQQVIKAVHEQLIEVLGGSRLKVTYASKPTSSSCRSPGAGKTTTAASCRVVKQQGRQPYLIAADLQRPAAVERSASWARRSVSTSSPNPRARSTREEGTQGGDAPGTRRRDHRHRRSASRSTKR